MNAPEARTEILPMVGDTVREALRSWRLPAALTLGVGFGLLERSYSHHGAAFLWGPVAALYTLLLGPLPWRLLVPLEEDGRRGEKEYGTGWRPYDSKNDENQMPQLEHQRRPDHVGKVRLSFNVRPHVSRIELRLEQYLRSKTPG